MVEAKIASTIIPISKDKKALILQYTSNHSLFPNLWTVPGGKMELDDGKRLTDVQEEHKLNYYATEKAALRELEEEAGIKETRNPNLLCTIYATKPNLLINSFYIRLYFKAKDIPVNINPKEHQAYRWIDKEELGYFNFVVDIKWELESVFDIVQSDMIECPTCGGSGQLGDYHIVNCYQCKGTGEINKKTHVPVFLNM
jgi:8-oxo-dGTP pyrophosphatase MutT (NUDIX family)